MNKEEFFLLIPGIINGVAIVDLLKVFRHKNNYSETVGWGIITMLAIISNWTLLYDDLETVTNNKYNFYLVVIQAIIIANIASVITPEEKDIDTKKYFLEVKKLFFLLWAVLIAYNYILEQIVFSVQTSVWLQSIAFGVFLICAFTNRYWIRYIGLGVVLLLILLHIFSDSIR